MFAGPRIEAVRPITGRPDRFALSQYQQSRAPFSSERSARWFDVQKRLVSVGNSVALILDKETRAVLGLKRTSLVKVRTDGRRLIVEPDGERPPAGASLMSEVEQVVTYLPNEFEMMFERMQLPPGVFRRLHHCPALITEETRKKRSPTRLAIREMSEYSMWLGSDAAQTPTAAEWETMRRFHVCYQKVASGVSWDEAAAYALAEVPMLYDPEAEPVELF